MKQLRFYLPLTVILGFFFFMAPKYIQGGDTSELVMASYHRLVAHPPGYPLFVWLQFFWTHLFEFSSVFWRASILSCVLGVIALAGLSLHLKDSNKTLLSVLLMVVALKPEVLESSVLPDVFSLHAVFIALIGHFFLFSPHQKKHSAVIFLFILSLTNHHTTVLLFPIFLYSLWHLIIRKEYRTLMLAAGTGTVLFIALYLSIFLLNPKHPLSWGEINNLSALVRHFLRTDYGTFQLAASKSSKGNEAFIFMLKNLWPLFLIGMVVVGLAIKDKVSTLKTLPFLTWSAALLITLAFPLIMNVTSEHVGAEVLRRFHVMPIVVLTSWALFLLRGMKLTKMKGILLFIATIPALYSNILSTSGFLNLRNDSVIEDYAKNLYSIGKSKTPSVIVAETDTSYFALRYLQSFDQDPKATKIAIVSLPLFFHPWYLVKVRSRVPDFNLPRSEEIYLKRHINKDQDIFKPNLARIRFFLTKGYKEGSKYKVTFFPLGRMLEEGKGVLFQDFPIEMNTTPEINYQGPQAFTKLKLFFEYSHFDYAKGVEKALANDFTGAQKSMEEAISKVPYAYPAMSSLCMNFPDQYNFCKSTELQELEEKTLYFY